MPTYEDPIVEEVHRTREKLLKDHGGNEGYAKHLQRIEAELKARVVTREPRPPAQTKRRA